jgi:antirestriction protein ArdC
MTDNTRKSSRKYDPLKPRTDVHEAITAKIVAAIEAGAGEFQMPWHRPGVAFTIPKNAVTGDAYRGSNVLSLWIDAEEKKFEHQVWATFKQYQAVGAQVRKGEKGSLIVKYGQWTPRADGPAGSGLASGKTGHPKHSQNDAKAAEPQPAESGNDADDPKRMFARAAWVFNIDQVDMPAELRAELLPAAAPRRDLTERLEAVERFVAAVGIEIREGGQRAFYRHPGSTGDGDFIQMPPRELFTGTATSSPTEAYYSTLLHEEIHGSGAKHRLDRQFGERFADKAYAFEELVAELGAAFLCAHLEVTNTPRPDHAQYIAHWLAVLKDDNRAIFSAASLATRAVDYLMGLQPKPEPDPTPHEPGDPTARLAPAGEKPEGPA